MKLIVIAIILWIIKAWIENDPKQKFEELEQEPPHLESKDWYQYGI